MPGKMTRRHALATGLFAAALPAGCGGQKPETPATSEAQAPARFWSPGPDKNLKRDLTPGQTPIRLSHNIRREGKESPEQMIKRKHDEGYAAIKGARHAGGNVGEPWNSLTAAERAEIVAACTKYDMVIYEVGGYTNLIHPDTTVRQKNLKAVAHCLEVAESVGCAMVGTIAGSLDPVNFFNVHPDNWTLATWNTLVASIRQILADTAGMKAGIGMEAQVTTILDGPKAHKRLLDEVGDPRCFVNLDVVNMVSLERYYHTTELINECFDTLGESIQACHIKDTLVIPDQQTVHITEAVPGDGVFDLETYLVRMSRMKWPRALETEHIPDADYPRAKAHIEKVAAAVGVKLYGRQ